ncbi:MAG: enoyl-CoA hydratase-related protein, partial [Corynebacterium variabile]
MSENIIGWDADANGVVTLTIDDPSAPVNVMNDAFRDSLAETVAKLQAAVEAKEISGVVITSAKKTFFAGGDIKSMITAGPAEAEATRDMCDGMKANFRALETL